MKQKLIVLLSFFMICFSLGSNAQSRDTTSYFAGKWNVMIKGLPNGDTKMIVNLEKKDNSYSGAILDSTNTEISKFSKVERTGYSITVYFTAQGYDVSLTLDKKDEDHVVGNMMSMFEAEGERAKEK
ncbi:hypothetical protein [Pollutibacter soli]|uniref:hypothetical protein n=1 Tax=Pollutibacter soli TaxID=3034157 RepID=UPI003013C9DE